MADAQQHKSSSFDRPEVPNSKCWANCSEVRRPKRERRSNAKWFWRRPGSQRTPKEKWYASNRWCKNCWWVLLRWVWCQTRRLTKCLAWRMGHEDTPNFYSQASGVILTVKTCKNPQKPGVGGPLGERWSAAPRVLQRPFRLLKAGKRFGVKWGSTKLLVEPLKTLGLSITCISHTLLQWKWRFVLCNRHDIELDSRRRIFHGTMPNTGVDKVLLFHMRLIEHLIFCARKSKSMSFFQLIFHLDTGNMHLTSVFNTDTIILVSDSAGHDMTWFSWGMFVEAQNFGSFASGPPFAQQDGFGWQVMFYIPILGSRITEGASEHVRKHVVWSWKTDC